MSTFYGTLAIVPPNSPRPATTCRSCGGPVSTGLRNAYLERPVLDDDGRFKRDENGRIVRELVPRFTGATCLFCVPRSPHGQRRRLRKATRDHRKALRRRDVVEVAA